MKTFKETVESIQDKRLHVFALGQAGFLVRNSRGELLGHDLYLSDDCEKFNGGFVGLKRLLPKILSPSDLAFDYLIATHPHTDHFDESSISSLMAPEKTHLFCSFDCQRLVQKHHLDEERVTYHQVGEGVKVGGYQIYFIACDHGEGAPDAFGVILEVDGIRILNVGDTSLHLEWEPFYNQFGPIDLMFAPINGEWGNLNERECVELVKVVKPRLFVPDHFGMCARHGGNAKLFYELMAEHCPEQKWTFLAIGESLTF